MALTLQELTDDYLLWLCQNRADSTYLTRFSTLQSFCAFIGGHVKAATVRPKDVEKWISKQKIADTTKHTRITTLKTMFNWAVNMEMLEASPIKNMPKPTPGVRQEFIPPERFNELFAACEDEHFRLFVTFMLDTGCRAQEMFVIEAQYVDFKNKKITLPASKSKGRRIPRVIYLSDGALAICAMFTPLYPTGKLFRTKSGVPWTAASLNVYFKPLKERMNIPGLCATTLRHSFAFNRLTKGQDPMIVAKLMGHTSTDMIFKRYGHLDGSDYLAAKAQEFGL